MLAHFAIRGLMHEAACKADTDPDQSDLDELAELLRATLRD